MAVSNLWVHVGSSAKRVLNEFLTWFLEWLNSQFRPDAPLAKAVNELRNYLMVRFGLDLVRTLTMWLVTVAVARIWSSD
jgi:hypothetical protein